MRGKKTMTLANAKPGAYQVVEVLNLEVARRYRDLGISPGAELNLLGRSAGLPYIYINGGVFGLDVKDSEDVILQQIMINRGEL